MSLTAENIGFYYRNGDWLFRNVNFELSRGEILGSSGYSGCGKTTFGKILARFISPREGVVTVDGETPADGTFQPVQMICQHPEKALNAKWRMQASLRESYMPPPEILDRFGIKRDWLSRFPIEISGGEMKRFCIVRALNPQTRYIVADEITSMLDAVAQADVWRELLEICRERRIGIAVISHESALLAKLCDRITSLRQMEQAAHYD